MNLNKPKNDNYAATIVQIKTIVPLENCDNVQGLIIMGNQVIGDKSIKEGDIGIYFPLETQLSENYLKYNNLYRKPELNLDSTQKGYFEENGRIRCVKFRGHKSEGLFMPLESLSFLRDSTASFSKDIPTFDIGGTNEYYIGITPLTVGDTFDELEGVEICRKYIPKHTHTPGLPGSKKNKSLKKFKSKLIENQFRFHQDTTMLYKNVHRINPNDIISISYKLHGTSGISSKILCKKKLKWYEKLLSKIGVNIIETQYDYVYSSRKVIKNEELNPNQQHFYEVDIWGIAHNLLKEFLQDGMTFYYEIVGYLSNGGIIQKDYDYGYSNPMLDSISEYKVNKHFGIYIYRITYTNISGKVFEFSFKQIQDFCKQYGLNSVPLLYYGYASEFYPELPIDYSELDQWRGNFLICIKEEYNEKDCFMCHNKVPEEGCVVRIEKNDFEAFKQKSNRFYERETKLLDKNEINIEDEN